MTLAAIAMALILSSAFGCWGVAVAQRLPPRHATWLLSAGGVIAALSGLAVLVLVGSLLVGEQPAIATEGHWSAAALREHAPVGRATASAAALLAGLLSAWAGAVAFRRARALLAAYRSCRELPPAAGELIVVPGTRVGAHAVPGRPGRIVAGQHLLSALSGGERRVLLAHERAHLDKAHHWHLAAVTIAAALNPLLGPLRGAVVCSTERWADEAAGEAVGDRRLVAQALASAARCGSHAPGALAATTHFVPLRVAALLGPAPAPRPLLVRVSLGLLLAAVGAVLVATKQTEHLYEFARRVRH
ncbi:MAG: M56 family metallopeptidase [Thermoleophilaceae bacterium]